ncbi:MAG: homoserine dehydrogenase [Candidatus Entotheonella factor]|uniref:Homoserine dehydrogenase n=1 Tax=Entotheonella factor TaxID=1429438 RepID=W4LPQ1_ENTF1|nr:homoserine dehydrogenase [Candidatus Entotheonella palauensis]ETW99814.1 MAG: homoserine dehydrogenase [Candidatus Entotheonella factor]
MQTIQVGLLGLGNVGTGVVEILQAQAVLLSHRLGAELALKKVATRTPDRPRKVTLAEGQLSGDVMDVLRDPEIAIVIELVGGYEPARTYILEALQQGKHVVTANKAVLARHGQELFEAARSHGVDIGFEASVGGGIPIIRTIKEAFVANQFVTIAGIINGTTNYILSRMSDQGLRFEDALKEAQDLGFAEADPSFDVDGIDAAQKISLLASLAYGTWVRQEDVYTEGITQVTQLDIAYARQLGYCVKLLALAKRDADRLGVRVHPALVAAEAELASVQGSYNAVSVTGDMVGRNLLIGHGAGALPTGSAVVGDVVDVARNVLRSSSGRVPPQGYETFYENELSLQNIDDISCKYYLRFQVLDQPGVLSAIAGILGEQGISIETVIQKGRSADQSDTVSVVMMTHEAKELAVRRALEAIQTLPRVKGETMRIRVEDSSAD